MELIPKISCAVDWVNSASSGHKGNLINPLWKINKGWKGFCWFCLTFPLPRIFLCSLDTSSINELAEILIVNTEDPEPLPAQVSSR